MAHRGQQGRLHLLNPTKFIHGRAGETVRCALHGWEFAIHSGEFLVDLSIKTRRFNISQHGHELYVHI